jgi:hypothetical protein
MHQMGVVCDPAIRCEFQTSRVRIQTVSDTGTVRACPTPTGAPL